MSRTATELGREFALNAADMNLLLRDHGFIEGRPGARLPPEMGMQFADSADFDNGYGGYAHRTWGWLLWPDEAVDALKASIEAHPDGIAPPVPAAPSMPAPAVSHGPDAAARPGRPTLTRNQWAAAAVLGVALAVSAAPAVSRAWKEKVKPAASRLRTRIAQRRTGSVRGAAPEPEDHGDAGPETGPVTTGA